MLGSWDHRNFKFANPRKVDRWVILNFSRANEQQVAQFADKLIQVGNIHGMAIQPYLFYRGMNRPRDEDVRRAFEEIFIKYKPLDLVVVVFSGTTTAYKVVKTAGDLTYGVSTQGVEDKNVQRISDQTVSNILLKINTKLGGRNFLLSPSNAL
jgi:eukaryotic translation initiation factor 2C